MTSAAPSRRERTFAGLAALGVAVAIAFGVRAGPGNAPTWVGDVAALTFALAGCSILAGVAGASRAQWLAALAASIALLVVALWVVFGPGNRGCTVSVAPLTGAVGGMLCRGAFGLGSLILVLFIVLVVRRGPPEAGNEP